MIVFCCVLPSSNKASDDDDDDDDEAERPGLEPATYWLQLANPMP